MKKKNGFTLVELLAVIVVLALIMIIAIPSVLKVMNSARKNSFALYVDKVVTAVQTQYLYDAATGSIAGAGFYVYDIQSDLDLTTTGSYRGYIVVDASNFGVDNPHYVVYLRDNNYMLYNYDVTALKMPQADGGYIVDYASRSTENDEAFTNSAICCSEYVGEGGQCKTREGYTIMSE